MKRTVFLIVTAFCLTCLSVPAVAQQTKEQLASYYYSNGEYAQAAELYEQLYQHTNNKYYYQTLYRSYMALGEYKDAEKLIMRRLRQYPKELSLYVDLGAFYESSGDCKKAEKTYNQALSKLSADSRQATDLSLSFQTIGRLDYAVQVLLLVRQKTNNQFLFVNELASLYEQQRDYGRMTQEYFELLDKSPGSMQSVQVSLQRALTQTSDPQLSEGLRQTLVSRVQSQPNNKSYLEMMIWFSLQQKDFQFAMTQAKAVEARFPELGGEQLYRVAKIAQSNQDHAVAAQCYQHLVDKGSSSDHYFDSRVGLLEVRFCQLERHYASDVAQVKALQADYLSAFEELGKNANTVPLMRNYASLMAYYANDVQAAADILYDLIEIPKLSSDALCEAKLELGDVLLFAGEVWDASLLYMQVEKAKKNDLLGAQAKFRNAKLSYYNGDFQWAKSQLDVLRASTSKLIANDAMELSLLISDNMEDDSTYTMLALYAAADMMLYRNQIDTAWAMFDDITHRALSHSLFDEILMQKAKIKMRKGEYRAADSLLQRLVDFYPTDILADDALFMLGQLNEEKLNHAERASKCYERLILDYSASLYVDQARKRYNALKPTSQPAHTAL